MCLAVPLLSTKTRCDFRFVYIIIFALKQVLYCLKNYRVAAVFGGVCSFSKTRNFVIADDNVFVAFLDSQNTAKVPHGHV